MCRLSPQGETSSSSQRLRPSGSASSLSASGSSRHHRLHHTRSHRDDSVAAGGHRRSHRSSHRSSRPEPDVDELGPRRASDPGAIWANEIADDEAMHTVSQPGSPGIGPRAGSGGLGAGSKAAWNFFKEKVSPGSARNRPPAHPSPGRPMSAAAASESPHSRAFHSSR